MIKIEVHATVNVHSDGNDKVLHDIKNSLITILKAVGTSAQDQATVDEAVAIINKNTANLNAAVADNSSK